MHLLLNLKYFGKKKLLQIIIIVIVLFVVIIYYFSSLSIKFNLNDYRVVFSDYISDMIHAKVEIKGSIDLYLSKNPIITFDNIDIALNENSSTVKRKTINVVNFYLKLSSFFIFYPIDVSAKAYFDNTELTFNGEIDNLLELTGYNLNLNLKSTNLNDLRLSSNYIIPDLGRIHFNSVISHELNNTQLSSFKLQMQGQQVFGDALYIHKKTRSQYFINVNSDFLDVDEIKAKFILSNKHCLRKNSCDFWDYYLSIKNIDIVSKINIELLKMNALSFSDVFFDSKLINNILTVNDYRLSYNYENFHGLLVLNFNEVNKKNKSIPIILTTKNRNIIVSIDGELVYPITRESLRLNLEIKGLDVRRFNRFVKYPLPNIGSYEIDGQLTFEKNKILYKNITGLVGNGFLSSNMTILFNNQKPRVVLKINADELYLSNIKNKSNTRKNAYSESSGNELNGLYSIASSIMQEELFKYFDLHLFLKIDNLIRYNDNIKNVNLILHAYDNKINIERFDALFPEGDMYASILIKIDDSQIDTTIKANLNHAEYGYLFRFYFPELDSSGYVDAEISLHSRMSKLEDFTKNLSGTINATFKPHDQRDDFIMVWDFDLYSSILNNFTNNRNMHLNCMNINVNFKNGVLHANKIVIDSNKSKIIAVGDISMIKNESKMTLVHYLKRQNSIDYKDFSLSSLVWNNPKYEIIRNNAFDRYIGNSRIKKILSIYSKENGNELLLNESNQQMCF